MANQSPIHSQHHIIPVSAYIKVWVALMFLLILTVVAADIDLGVLNNIIAMAISVTKAVLVIMIFMGVYYSTKLTKVWAMVGFVWVLFLTGILSDYAARPNIKGFAGEGSILPVQAQYIGTPLPDEAKHNEYIAPNSNPKLQEKLSQH